MTPAKRAVLASVLALSACASSTGPSGRWIGQVIPKIAGPVCVQTRGVLQIRDNLVSFEPNEGTWTLQGEAKPDGTLYADKSQIGTDKKPYETTLEARWTPTTVTGTYTTPRCTFAVNLSRPT
jgi:hypothetical protein